MKIHLKKFAVVGTALVAAAAFAYQVTAQSLYKDGQIVSGKLRVVDGTLYVPVRDVATFLGGTLNVSNDRADITTVAQPTGTPTPPATDGAAQTITPDLAPPLSVPANPIATTAVAPPPAPAQLTAGLNQDVTFDGFSYRVTSVEYRDREYKDQYDQRGTKLHPQWKGDKLAVVEFTVKNVGSVAGTPSIPGEEDFSLLDAQKVGYAGATVDIRQAPGVLGDEMTDDTVGYGLPVSLLAPGGSISFAVVGSLPKSGTVQSITFRIAPPSLNWPSGSPSMPAGTLTETNAPATNLPMIPATTDPSFNPSGAEVTITIS